MYLDNVIVKNNEHETTKYSNANNIFSPNEKFNIA